MTDQQRRPGGADDDAALDRIVQRLQSDDAGDPPYRDGRFAELVRSGTLSEGDRPGRLAGPHLRSPLLSGLGIGTIGLAVVLVIGLIAVRQYDANEAGGTPSPSGGDLLNEVHGSGVLRVAIRPDFPQATTDKLAGFDVDVANALAARLGVRLQIVITDAPSMATEAAGSWDIAMPSSSGIAAAGPFLSSDPYYAFPTLLVVGDGSTAQAPADLAGGRICVVAGSAGQDWIEGRRPRAVVPPPSGPASRVEANDQACLDALTAGEVDAVATASLSPADVAVRPAVRILGQPVLSDPRAVVARADGSDPTALLDAVDAALTDMRAGGTLTDLSRSQFGGQDLSIP